MSTTMIIDTMWVFLVAILIFFMNLGFASVEAGFARAKNTVNILSKNFIVFAVMFFDRIKIDDPVGAFVFVSTALVWLALKYTIGIRVSKEEEIAGLDIGEHGNIAYPDFVPVAPISGLSNGIKATKSAVAATAEAAVSLDTTIPVVHKEHAGVKMTKVTIITIQTKFSELEDALDKLGITGQTVTNVLGHGMQKGHKTYFRGAPVDTRLLPKLKIDIIICKILTQILVDAVREVLYIGNVDDAKIFIYDVEDVIKIRTNVHGYDALQDEE